MRQHVITHTIVTHKIRELSKVKKKKMHTVNKPEVTETNFVEAFASMYTNDEC